MIKISILRERPFPMTRGKANVAFTLDIRFRSDKELDVVWSKLKGIRRFNTQWHRYFPCLGSLGVSLAATDRGKMYPNFHLFVFARSRPGLTMEIVECCKRDIEGLLMDAAIKGDLNTK